MTTNPFKDKEKKKSEKVGGGEPDNFEKVATEIENGGAPEGIGAEYVGNVEDVSPAQAAGADEKFIVTDELSAQLVRGIFYPLAHYRCGGLGHPAWEVSIEESMSVAPPVTELVQECVDKWVPSFLSKYGAKHSKLLSAIFAVSGLVAKKTLFVREMIALEAQQRAAAKEKAEADAARERAARDAA